MGKEIDLLANYPKAKRNVSERGATKTEADREIARRFGVEYFDGDRKYGYGGFSYQSRFWQPVVPTFQKHFGIKAGDSLLDIGCAKGFMLHDFAQLIPGLNLKGIDVSKYAIDNVIEDMKPNVQVADCRELPFPSKSFDVVIAINTLHNLEPDDCIRALKEIERVGRGKSFLTVDAYRNAEEKKLMDDWNLTAKTYMSVDEWVEFFKKAGYTGDYYWFIP